MIIKQQINQNEQVNEEDRSFESFIDQLSSWKEPLKQQEALLANIFYGFISKECDQEICSPSFPLIFNAFKQTPFNQLKVVILAQEPNLKINSSIGLAFAQNKTQENLSPSLKNIFAAIKHDYPEFHIPNHGDLTSWANQGVLLLHQTLTCQVDKVGVHRNKGWEEFTTQVLTLINQQLISIVFLAWGTQNQNFLKFIDREKHHILESSHPSPLAGKGFLTCGHFKKCNEILVGQGREPINWQIE